MIWVTRARSSEGLSGIPRLRPWPIMISENTAPLAA